MIENPETMTTLDQTSPPKDKYNLVYTILIVGGIFVLLPWNMFITLQNYFVDYKLSEDYIGKETQLATYFITYLGIVSQIPSVLFEYFNLFIRFSGDLKKRIQFILIIQTILFLVTVLLAILNTSTWPTLFFIITMITVFLINMNTGIFQNSLYGLSVLLPEKYVGAVLIGSNVSGILIALLSIVIMSTVVSYQKLAIMCFSISAILLFLLFCVLFYLSKNEFYKFYTKQYQTSEFQKLKMSKIIRVIKKYKIHLFNITYVFFITLSCFPTILSYVQRSDSDFIIPEKYFTVTTCFLLFNVATTIGCITSKYVKIPKQNSLTYFILLRSFFIPLFLFCNYVPANSIRHLPIWIQNDWIYMILVFLFGFTSGHFSSLSFNYLVVSTEKKHTQIGGMIGAISLINGIFLGLLVSAAFPYLIRSV